MLGALLTIGRRGPGIRHPRRTARLDGGLVGTMAPHIDPTPMPTVVPRPTDARRVVARSLAAALLALGVACVTATEPKLTVLDLTISAPAPLVRNLHVSLGVPAALTVDYWTTDGPRLRVRSDSGVEHDVLFTRLRPGRTYQISINGGAVTGSFDTDTLPSSLAAVRFQTTGSTDAVVMLQLSSPTGYNGLVAVDGGGNVVWYWPTVGAPLGMTRRANGNFVVLDVTRGLSEVTPGGQTVAELPQDLTTRQMHHDVIAGRGDTLLFIAYDDRVVNGQRIRGDAIWAWVPETGASFRRWTAWDHFSPSVDSGPRSGSEWMHANALALGPRGNVTMSVHFWDQIISITPDWTGIEWRLGGVNATIPVRSADRFSGQHSAREIVPNHVLLFNNDIERGGPSRPVELALDGDSAHAIWEFRSSPANFATAIGSARRMANGHTMVGFGMSPGLAGSTGPIEVYEVDAAGVVAWHMVVTGPLTCYRAEPLTTIGGEQVVP